MSSSIQIYVCLLDEGIDAWRPVQAVNTYDNVFQIISENPDPENEKWEFASGSLVRCRSHAFADGTKALIAYERIFNA